MTVSPATAELDPQPVRFPFGLRTTRRIEQLVATLALAAAAVGVSISVIDGGPLGVIPIVLAALIVPLGTRVPWLTIIILAGAPPLAGALGSSSTVVWTIVVQLCLLTTLRGFRARIVGPLAAVGAFGDSLLSSDVDFFSVEGLIAFSLALAAAMGGTAIREHFRFLAAVEEGAARAVETRLSETARRVSEERLHIARDLHDAVGHQVAVVSMQLGVAEVALLDDVERSRSALADARRGLQAVLHESQRLLTVLRSDGVDEHSRQPNAGIDGIGSLVATFRAAGRRIDAEIVLPDRIDAMSGAAAYRIVQEALTNAERHGRGAVELRMVPEGDELLIEVSNAVGARSDEGSGFGQIGMRERIESLGGTLRLRSGPERYRVEARIPLTEKRSR